MQSFNVPSLNASTSAFFVGFSFILQHVPIVKAFLYAIDTFLFYSDVNTLHQRNELIDERPCPCLRITFCG